MFTKSTRKVSDLLRFVGSNPTFIRRIRSRVHFAQEILQVEHLQVLIRLNFVGFVMSLELLIRQPVIESNTLKVSYNTCPYH
jgi:transcriptional regulator with GAF, ATPase, and Fis domain